MTVRQFCLVPIVVLSLALAACESKPKLVYVLEGSQSVTLIPSVSSDSVAEGESVVLSVERRTSGNWKQVPLNEVRGRCWVYRPPPEVEPQVADTLRWIVEPEGAVWFPPEHRLDRTRVATMLVKGTVTLTPVSTVTCEEGRLVEGPPITIEVH
ncbi:MAG: hypothetical protein C0P74_007755 [Gammaproteobacteria bacterium]